jgi:hypothetical protein
MSRALLALVLMLAAVPGAPAREALAALDSCIHQLEPELDVGYEKIAARCPDLKPSLADSPWAAWLPSDWDKPQNNLSLRGLRELRTLIVRESALAGGARRPDVGRVAAVLAALRNPGEAQRGWWARFKAWLHAVLEARAQRPERDWFRRLFAQLALPRTVLDVVSVVALALVVALATVIVAGELRAAGVLRARRTRTVDGQWARPGAPAAGGWADIESAAAAERPRLLLELIAARLAEQQRLPPARSLTVQELTRAARLPADGDRERLAQLAQVSERLRFSGRVLPPGALDGAVQRGRELLADLDAVPG